jgi:DNA mismatch endonuclease (patch repair protein)
MDTLDPRERSERMARIASRDTGPERVVAEVIRTLRFRPHRHPPDVSGKPDFVFRSRRAVVFVHGCFWHRHTCRNGQRLPKSRLDFWAPKLEANRLRDARTRRKLRASGWRVMVIWECQTQDKDKLAARLRRFLVSD